MLLRLFTGFMFWQHGAQKLFGFFGGPQAAPFTLAWFAGAAEFLGAIAIAIGFLTRPFAAILALDMAALYLVEYLPLGFPPVLNRDGEVACLLLVIAGLLVTTGPGKFSIDTAVKNRQRGSSGFMAHEDLPDPGVLSIFRVLVGLLFIQHGLQKMFGMLGEEAVPFPEIRWFAGIIELYGGLAITFGLFTRIVTFIACGQMAVAYFMNHAPRGFWPIQNLGERAVLFCYIYMMLVTTGPGKWSLDTLLWKKSRRTEEPVALRN
jgi:putative oxidoreductase